MARRRVFITVAEVSGDKHAAQLVRSLRALDPELLIEGLGGSEMAAAGAVVHRDTVARAAMGWRGALRALEVIGLLRWARRHFASHRPDLLIGVDSPSMNFHFARLARRLGVPTLQYVAPQLWAWASWRMRKVRRWIDRVACILPFEEAYFRAHGVNATFVGHPLFDELPANRAPTGADRAGLGDDDDDDDDGALRGANGAGANAAGTNGGGNGADNGGGAGAANGRPGDRPPVVGLLPGSRRSEAEHNFPHLLAVARRVAAAFPGTTFLVPTTAATHPVVAALAKSWVGAATDLKAPPGVPVPGADPAGGELADAGGNVLCYARDAFDRMVPRCDLCVVVSGTATLHVAGFGVPMIVVYRINRLAWHVAGRWLVRARTFSLVNLLSNASAATGEAARAEHVVPEIVPWYGPDEPVARLATEYLRDPRKLAEQRRRLRQLLRSLDHPGASDNVARLALEMMGSPAAPAPARKSEARNPEPETKSNR